MTDVDVHTTLQLHIAHHHQGYSRGEFAVFPVPDATAC